jgi:hypothetical protein
VRPPALAASVVLSGELRGGLAPLPRPAVGLAIDVEDTRVRLFSPSARVAVVASESQLGSSQGSAGLVFLGGRIEACPLRWGTGRVALRPCLGFEIGNVWAKSHTSTNPQDATQVWPSGEGLLRLRWVLFRGFFLESSLGAGLSFLRPRYFFRPNQTLYAVPVITGRGAVGAGYRF